MNISGNLEYKKALLLSPLRVNELISELMSFCDRIEFTAVTTKGLEIQFDSLDEMLTYDNFGERRLYELELVGYVGSNRVFSLRIKDAKGMLLHYYTTVQCHYHFNSFDSETLFVSKIKYLLKKSTPSYWILGKLSLWGITVVGSIINTFVNYLSGKVPQFRFDISLLIGTILACGILAALWVFDKKFYYNIFPAVAFLWGEEKQRYDKWQKLRSNLFWGVIMALIIGLLGTWIANTIWG